MVNNGVGFSFVRQYNILVKFLERAIQERMKQDRFQIELESVKGANSLV